MDEVTLDESQVVDLAHLTPESLSTQRLAITQEFLFGEGDDRAFLLRNLFSPEECEFYIKQADSCGLESVSKNGFRNDTRNNDRLCGKSQALADELFKRVQPFLKPMTVEFDQQKCVQQGVLLQFGIEGEWQPHCINNLFRICRYRQGGHFAPHYDGHYQPSPDMRSFKTVMLYLNNDFTGGSTNFVKDDETLIRHSSGRYQARENSVYLRIQPESGMAIVFNHRILHEGGVLESVGACGGKWILRTEAMYTRTSQPERTPQQLQAFELLREAEALESLGKQMEAMQKYRQAFKLCPELELTA